MYLQELGVEAGERKEDWDRAEIEILCCRLGDQRIPGKRFFTVAGIVKN